MRIGIDSRPLGEKQTSGIPMFVRSMIDALAKIDKKNEYYLYSHADFNYELSAQNFHKMPGKYARYGTLWMQTELPMSLVRNRIDVFWGTQHTIPLLFSSKIKMVLTIHDLVHCVFPETMKPLNLLVNKLLIPPSVKRADVIVADTGWTLSDVKKYLNPQNKKMEVVYLGISSRFSKKISDEDKKKVRSRYGLPEKFLLTVGTFEPRKNIAGLFRAFATIADKIPHDLAVVGQKGWKNEIVRDEIQKARIHNRIHLLGYIPDEVLPDIYASADLFVFPSVYEGFGLPPLEAMASGTPVVSSNVSSIPEIVGDAALLMNPHDPVDMAEGILKMVSDKKLRSDLILKGLARSQSFGWGRAAEQMLNIFESLN